MKVSYHNYPPPITAPANKGQDLQVPSRPLSRGYTDSSVVTLCEYARVIIFADKVKDTCIQTDRQDHSVSVCNCELATPKENYNDFITNKKGFSSRLEAWVSSRAK